MVGHECGDETDRGHIEGRIDGTGAGRCGGHTAELDHFASAAVFDFDVRAGRGRRVNGRFGGDDNERHAGVAGSESEAETAHLVGSVAVRGNAVGTDEYNIGDAS